MQSLFQPSSFAISSTKVIVQNSRTNPPKKTQIGFEAKPQISFSFSIQKSLPLAASVALLLLANPAKAGLMSGFPGIESVPGPELPQIDFLSRFNEENQKKYAENDERFKSTPILKQLLERSKLNKEKNEKEIQDKYCLRGAEWGVGDCSAEGMSMEDRDKFIAMLKEKAGVK